MNKGLSRWIKRKIKGMLLTLRLWSLAKKLAGRDKPGLLNSELVIEGRSFYSQFLLNNDLVFDVGANVGNRVDIFLSLGCRVVAVEPQRDCVRYLESRFVDKIRIEEVGLGAAPDYKTLYESDNSVLSTFSDSYIDKVKAKRHATSFWRPANKIRIMTLDQLIEKYGTPSFIKIDVEGYELEVLKGLTRIAGIISFEYTVPELTGELRECLERLHEIGYNSFNYSVGESMRLDNPWHSFAEFVKVVETEEFLSTRFGDVYTKHLL